MFDFVSSSPTLTLIGNEMAVPNLSRRLFKITFWYTQETFVAFPPRGAVVLSFWFGSLCIDKATSGQFWPAL